MAYTMHIMNGNKLMPYKGKGYGWPDTNFGSLDMIRRYACTLIPRDSKTRMIKIYCDGTSAGKLIRRDGKYLYAPAHPEYDLDLVYVINPKTGKTVPGSRKEVSRDTYKEMFGYRMGIL